MERCKHGMILAYCVICTPPQVKLREPKPRAEKTVFGSGTVNPENTYAIGYVVVYPRKNHPSHAMLDEKTKIVHIVGEPLLWLFRLIFEKAVNVKKIEVIPRLMCHVKKSHRDLCAENSVEIIAGHARPDLVWEEGRMLRLRDYRLQKEFLLALEGEQKRLFDELEVFGFEVAEITLEYYGLRGDAELTQQELAEKYGLTDNRVISNIIQGIFFYLDPTFPTGIFAKDYARRLGDKVLKLRSRFHETAEREKMTKEAAQRLGLSRLPDKLPLSRLDILESLLKARAVGLLDRLQQKRAKWHRAVALRFDLYNNEPSVYRTLQSVGDMLGGITREAVRQMESNALNFLGIEDLEV